MGPYFPIGIVVWSLMEAALNRYGISSSPLSVSFPGVIGPTGCLISTLLMWPAEAFEFAISD